jgi:uncharacterized protein YndB with AHSA1/START domain
VSQGSKTADATRELMITHIFDAPRALVFAAWTEPKHLARWSGPSGFTTTQDRLDVRSGGSFRSCLRAPDGTEHWVQGVYREVVASERLVFTHAWEREDGTVGPETIVMVTFTDHGSKTLMTFHQAIFESVTSRDGHKNGWSQSFDRLADYLSHSRATISQLETSE